MESNKLTKSRLIAISILLLLFFLILIFHDALFNFVEQETVERTEMTNYNYQEYLDILDAMESFNIEIENIRGLRQKRMLDPLQYARHASSADQLSNFQELYAKIRNKRDKIELTKLENEYIRCRKSLDKESTNSDCFMAFVKLYNTAKKFVDEIEEMNSHLNPQNFTQTLNDTQAESREVKNNGTLMEPHSIDKSNITQEITQAEYSEISTEQSKDLINPPIFKPSRISWIIDGQDQDKKNDKPHQLDSNEDIPTTVVMTEKSMTKTESSLIETTLPISTEGLLLLLDSNEFKNEKQVLTNIDDANSFENMVENFEFNSKTNASMEKVSTDSIDFSGNLKEASTELNPVNIQAKEANQYMSMCEYMAAQRLRNKNPEHQNRNQNNSETDDVQFTSRAPMGFPVTGETMKASAQFMFNPNFGTPTIPLCFFVTPANMRFMQQTPMWSPSYASMSPNMFNFMGGGIGGIGGVGGVGVGGAGISASHVNQPFQMGSAGSSAIFMIPPNFGGTGGNSQFMSPLSGSAGGSQGNIANMANMGNMAIFTKNVTPFKSQQQQQQQQNQAQQQQQNQGQQQQNQAQPRQLFCTYMPNEENKKFVDQSNPLKSTTTTTTTATGNNNNNFPTQGFVQLNTKLRQQVKKPTFGTDIIYTSFMEPFERANDTQTNNMKNFECPELNEQIACLNHNECIGNKNWCDGFVDCTDGSDEASCTCRDRLLDERVCDGYADCPMGEDEIGCFGCDEFMYSCYENLAEYEAKNHSHINMCYNRLEKCDGFKNCLNGRDEIECNLIISQADIINTHVISSSAGYLYRNYRGEWYPVCNNAQKWAEEACENEYLAEDVVSISYRELLAKGPFIEQVDNLQLNFPHTCKRQNEQKLLTDQMVYVRCHNPKCGMKRKYTLALPIKRHKRNIKKQRIPRQTLPLENERIVGGIHSKPHEWPFIVALYKDGQFHCGATIFNAQWVN